LDPKKSIVYQESKRDSRGGSGVNRKFLEKVNLGRMGKDGESDKRCSICNARQTLKDPRVGGLKQEEP